MIAPSLLLPLAGFGLGGVAIAAGASLRGWKAWLNVKKLEIAGGRPRQRGRPPEIAELRARVRRLEAIADGTLP